MKTSVPIYEMTTMIQEDSPDVLGVLMLVQMDDHHRMAGTSLVFVPLGMLTIHGRELDEPHDPGQQTVTGPRRINLVRGLRATEHRDAIPKARTGKIVHRPRGSGLIVHYADNAVGGIGDEVSRLDDIANLAHASPLSVPLQLTQRTAMTRRRRGNDGTDNNGLKGPSCRAD